MQREYFIALEHRLDGERLDLDEVLDRLAFTEQGLIPAITQDHTTKEVLMFAWMNRESLQKTLNKGRVCYWSRSRQALWTKGETSGHVQNLVSLSIDCDGDAILCQVEQAGVPCHTGRQTCFYLQVDTETKKIQIKGDCA